MKVKLSHRALSQDAIRWELRESRPPTMSRMLPEWSNKARPVLVAMCDTMRRFVNLVSYRFTAC
jgi:hypothetical protein